MTHTMNAMIATSISSLYRSGEMPIRDFECKSCGHIFELLVFSKTERKECPECTHTKLIPLPSAHGGYKIKGDNGSSQSPKQSASFKKGKI